MLECEHHLSYPFVFQHDGAIYMLPETGEAGRVELHRAVEFPDTWRLDRVLLDGLTALDATLHIEDGIFWLFANVVEGQEGQGFSSGCSLRGHWTGCGALTRGTRTSAPTRARRARPAGCSGGKAS